MSDMSEHEWGLVLAGGGGKGAYQIGVFKALEEYGADDYITMVSGSSVGALNAILFAYGDIKMAEDLWSGISHKTFLSVSPDIWEKNQGLASRDGLVGIFDNYIDFEKIRNNEKSIYASVTDYGENGREEGIIKYYRLNYKKESEIRDILLASSALPILYSPVRINGNICRDGGLTDNLPIAPLYIEGIRKFIVVGLSENTVIDCDRFPGAEFILIRPERSIGDFVDGTIDFNGKNAVERMNMGYADAVRCLEFYGEDMTSEAVRIRYAESVKRDYEKIDFESRKTGLKEMVNRDMDKISSLIDKYIGE